MYCSFYIFTFTSLLSSYSTSAYPVTQPPLLPRQTDCTVLNQGFDPSCWSVLGLSKYLDNWNKTTPVCTANNGNGCCNPDELWSNCFIRLATNGLRTDDCSIINKACASEPTYAEEQVTSVIAPEVYYIVHSIYYMNDFFTSWYDALDSASISALFVAQPIINEIDPEQKSRFGLNDLLTALTVGLAFLPAVGEGISEAAETGLQILKTGLQQAPGVAEAIWPSGTSDTKSIQLANIDTELATASSNFTTGVTNALAMVMSDVPSFIAFAQNGSLSGQDEVSLPSDANSLGLALDTYVLSTAMTANQWHASPYTSLTMEDVASSVPGSGGSDCTFGSNNICTNADHSINVFYSNITARAYTLAVPGADPDLNPFTLMNDIVANDWSTLEALFDGAFNCTVAGGFGESLDFFTGDAPDFSCVSQLQMCSCEEPCPVAMVGGVCPFADCGSCS